MHQIQILLPLNDNDKKAFPREYFQKVRCALTEKFGGLTIYSRSPALGLWENDEDHTLKDDIIVLEVMTEILDQKWWQCFRLQLEETFKQDKVIIREQSVQLL